MTSPYLDLPPRSLDDVLRGGTTQPPQLDGAKPIGWAHIPNAVLDEIGEEHRDGLFIVTVDGDCLAPAARNGDRALVSPTMPIRRGDFVVLWPRNAEHQPAIKRLVLAPPPCWESWHPDSEVQPIVVVEQTNPPRQLVANLCNLSVIHRVVTILTPSRSGRARKPRRQKA